MRPSLPTLGHRAGVAAVLVALLLAACSTSGSGDDVTTGASSDERKTTTTTTASTTTEAGSTTSGGDAGGDGRDAYVEAVGTGMIAEAETDDSPFTEDQIRCLAGSFVDAVGYERLADAGITPEALVAGDEELDGQLKAIIDDEEATARQIAASFDGCEIDVKALVLEEIAADDSITPEQVACIDRRLPEDFFADLFVQEMLGKDTDSAESEASDAMSDAILPCLMGG